MQGLSQNTIQFLDIRLLCRLYTLAECVRRDSRARVTRDETVRVWLCTLSPWALNPSENVDWKKTIKILRRQPGETRDPLTRALQTAKKAKADEVRHERQRLYESMWGECLHLYSCSRFVSCSLGESVQPALHYPPSSLVAGCVERFKTIWKRV